MQALLSDVANETIDKIIQFLWVVKILLKWL